MFLKTSFIFLILSFNVSMVFAKVPSWPVRSKNIESSPMLYGITPSGSCVAISAKSGEPELGKHEKDETRGYDDAKRGYGHGYGFGYDDNDTAFNLIQKLKSKSYITIPQSEAELNDCFNSTSHWGLHFRYGLSTIYSNMKVSNNELIQILDEAKIKGYHSVDEEYDFQTSMSGITTIASSDASWSSTKSSKMHTVIAAIATCFMPLLFL